MGRFYKTHTRWIASAPVKKASPVIVDDLEVNLGVKDLNNSKKVTKAHAEPPKESAVKSSATAYTDVASPAEASKPEEVATESPVAMLIEKKETKEGILCEIIADLDYDEIRYNIGSKKVTEKNKNRCKRYEGAFILEEPAVVNASAFKDDILICSVQG